jgi:hypothetical protein
MRRIRQETINIGAGVSAKGERQTTTYAVDVWGDDHATDEIFKGTSVPQGPGAGSRAVHAEPPTGLGFEDATFSPQGMNTPPKPPKAGGSDES